MKKKILSMLLMGAMLSTSVLAAPPQWYEPDYDDALDPGANTIPMYGNITQKNKQPIVDPDAGYVLSISSPIELHFAVFDGNLTNTNDDPTFSSPNYKFVSHTSGEVTVAVESVKERTTSSSKYTLVNAAPTAANQIKISAAPGTGFKSGSTNTVVLHSGITSSVLGKIDPADSADGKTAEFKLNADLFTALPTTALNSTHDIIFKFTSSPSKPVQTP